MKSYPTTTALKFLCLILLTFAINHSCSKDNELLRDAVLENQAGTIDEKDTSSEENEVETDATDSEPEEEIKEDEIESEAVEKVLESRTTIFPPIHDAHLQAGKGYDQNIVRLEEGRRISYLMFDLSKIDSIGGTLTETNLEFTIDSDDGSGTIAVFKGDSNDWSEQELSDEIAPEPNVQLGELATKFSIGGTHEIELDTTNLEPSTFTLILTHEGGNDLAFASKEHPTREGPKLVVSYNAPQNAEAIFFDEEVVALEVDTDEVTEEVTDSSQEEVVTENEVQTNPEEETSGEGTDGVEETVEEETVEEETVEEETADDEEAEEEVTAEEEATEEEITETPDSEADAPQNEAPMAVADATPSSGNAPLKVAFKGSSSNDDLGINSYVWDFGDGSSSSDADTSYTFTKVGTYEVSLTVRDEQGETDTDVVTIIVKEEENQAPVAAPKASPSSGEAPLEVQFNGRDSTDDTAITSYTWDFKDGAKADTANPSHTFEEPGIYEVVLTVRDENGLENSRIVKVTVTASENKAPVAAPKATPSSGQAPLEVQFNGDDSSDDNGITAYTWDFKDGSKADTANPSHTFNEPGTYKVVLSVEDENGLSDARIVEIRVTAAENEAPVAVATGSPLTGDAPLEVRFNANNSEDDNEITGYFWDFKDGSTTTNKNPSHTFKNPGEYKVELSVKDAQGLTNSTTIDVKVNQPQTNTSGSGGSSGGSGGSGGSSGGSGNSGGSGSNPNSSNGIKASSFGYSSGNATRAIKDAINSSHSTIIIDRQSSDWVVEPLTFKNIRNKTIIFEDGVTLRAKSGEFRPEDRLFQFVDSDNITISGYGATLRMNKSQYSGQQNHALSLIGCSNVTVKGLTIRDSGGDGIYVSRYSESDYCRNIEIDGVSSINNKRQGMTVISVDGLVIKNSTFSESSGASPAAGIDFEPESTHDRLDNISVSNSTFKDNDGPGIMFAVNKANGSSRPLDATFRNVKVSNNSLSNTRVYPTEIDLGMSTDYRTNPIKGTITFDGLTVENSRWSAIWTKKTLEAYHINVKNALIRNVSRGSSHAAIHIGVLGYGNTSNANMGGFTFENVLIDYDGVDPSVRLHGPSHGNWNLRNMRGEIRVRSPRGVRFVDNTNKLANTNSSTVTLKIVED